MLPTSDDATFQFIVVNTELATPADLNGKQLVINPSVQDDLESGTNHIDLVNVQESSDDDGVLQTDVDSSQFNQGAVTNSVGNRLYIYSNKVSYCLEGSRLERNGVTVGDYLTSDSSFASGDTNSPNSDSLSRSGLIHIKLSFKQNDETTEYENDIQVLNVP